MISSSFTYELEKNSNFIREIYELINFNESGCDIYTMDYSSQSPTHCSKGNLEYVLQCTIFHQIQNNGLIIETKRSSIKQKFMKLGDGLQKKWGRRSTHALHLITIS